MPRIAQGGIRKQNPMGFQNLEKLYEEYDPAGSNTAFLLTPMVQAVATSPCVKCPTLVQHQNYIHSRTFGLYLQALQ